MGRVDALSRRNGSEEAGGYDKLLIQGDTPHDKSTPNGETAVLLLEDQDLDPLTGIDISNWSKNADALWIVPEHHRADVLKQCHDSLVVGHWGHDRTRELISRNFV